MELAPARERRACAGTVRRGGQPDGIFRQRREDGRRDVDGDAAQPRRSLTPTRVPAPSSLPPCCRLGDERTQIPAAPVVGAARPLSGSRLWGRRGEGGGGRGRRRGELGFRPPVAQRRPYKVQNESSPG